MCNFDDIEIISVYPLSQAIEDGVLVKLCDIRFGVEIKPLVATSHLFEEVGRDQVMNIPQFIERCSRSKWSKRSTNSPFLVWLAMAGSNTTCKISSDCSNAVNW